AGSSAWRLLVMSRSTARHPTIEQGPVTVRPAHAGGIPARRHLEPADAHWCVSARTRRRMGVGNTTRNDPYSRPRIAPGFEAGRPQEVLRELCAGAAARAIAKLLRRSSRGPSSFSL